MARTTVAIASSLFLVACGGGGGEKKTPKKPTNDDVAKPEPPKKETEEDREKKRMAAAQAIVPDGSTCLPLSLKEPGAPKLEVAAINGELVVCAIDEQEDRLLGPVACWKVDLKANPIALAYIPAAPIPGRGITVKVDERCARGYCLPKDAKGADTALLAWNPDGTKVAAVVGDDLHIFDAATKAHEKSFSIRGDKGVTNDPFAVHWVGDALFVEGRDAGPFAAVFVFKTDGTAVGAIEAMGGTKPASTFGGSFSILDKNRVAVAEQGFSTVTIYESDTGKRSKLVRKLAKPPCKAAELETYWNQSGEVPQKCKDHMEKHFGHLMGASGVAGAKSFVIALRGPRVGELGLLDLKTLAEKSSLKLPWCTAEATADAGGGGGGDAGDEADAPKPTTRAPAKKPAKAEDPDAGGE